MELTVLLNYILGGTSLAGIIGTLFYYKHNKKLKQNEVSQSDTKTQSEQINLGMQFIENSKKAVEMIQQTTQSIDDKINDMTKTINTKMTAEEMRQRIIAAADRLPYPVRIEEGKSWLHIDCYDTATGKKITTFKG